MWMLNLQPTLTLSDSQDVRLLFRLATDSLSDLPLQSLISAFYLLAELANLFSLFDVYLPICF